MRTTRSLIAKLRLLGLVLCGLVLSACSQDSEVVTEPVLIRDGIAYYQNTNELVTGIVEKFSDSGLLQSRANYRDGEEVVQTIFNYFENEQLEFRENYRDGVKEGLFEWFHENGQLDVRGNYIDGEREGLYEEFDRNGNLTQTGTWENGELVETNLDP
jgi:antitoxin component YwqK of YwqJK toxin-antitoxin module